tara:strand:+ start:1027 stop:1356 length:330 start_codon:yes stop_codon:yes gene_type:complete
MILSTFAIRVADGQFMSAIVISPQSAKAEDPNTVIADAMEIPVNFLNFIKSSQNLRTAVGCSLSKHYKFYFSIFIIINFSFITVSLKWPEILATQDVVTLPIHYVDAFS